MEYFLDNIFCEDCFKFIKKIPNDSVDLVVTSPPYADKRKNYTGCYVGGYAYYLLEISQEIMRVLKPTGSFILNVKESADGGRRMDYLLKYQNYMNNTIYIHVETFIWVKTNPFPTGNVRRLKDAFEYCYHYAKSKNYKFFPNNAKVPSRMSEKNMEAEGRRKNKGSHNVTNQSGMSMSKRYLSKYVRPSNVLITSTSNFNLPHSAVFPLELPEFFIKLMTEENDIVLDPFMGSGTTALVCKSLNRRFIGIEKEQEYVDLAKKRLKASEKL